MIELQMEELALATARLNLDLAMERARVRMLNDRIAELEAELKGEKADGPG